MMTNASPEALVPMDVAVLDLRMNRERLVRRIQDGILPGRKIGGRWFVEREALDRAVAEGVPFRFVRAEQ